MDFVFVDTDSTRVVGEYTQGLNGGSTMMHVRSESGSSKSFSFTPVIERNWTNTVGLIVGVKLVATGRNTGVAVIPVAAINLVF